MNQCLLQSFRFAAGTLHSTMLNREHEEKHKPIAPSRREVFMEAFSKITKPCKIVSGDLPPILVFSGIGHFAPAFFVWKFSRNCDKMPL